MSLMYTLLFIIDFDVLLMFITDFHVFFMYGIWKIKIDTWYL